MKERKINEVNFDVKLDETDLYKYNLKQAYSNAGVILFSVIGAFGLIYLPIFVWKVMKEGLEPPIMTYFLFVITLFSANLPLIIKRSSRKLMASNKLLQQTQHYKITEQEILISSVNGNTQITWENVFKVREEKNYFSIFISKAQAYLIPKRFFYNSKDVDALKDIMRQSLPSTKLKLR